MYITCKRLLNVECVSGNLKLAIVFLNSISSNKLLGAYWKEVTKSRGERLLSSPVVNQAYLSPIIQFTRRVITVFQAATILVVMASRKKISATKIVVKVTNLATCVQQSHAKIFPRNSRDFVRCIFIYALFS